MANCSEIHRNRLSLTLNQNIVVFVITVITACLTVTTNSVLAVTLWKSRQLNNSTNIYIFLLSLSDCMQGTVTMPLTSTVYLTYDKVKKCKLFISTQAFSPFNIHLSGYLILLIAFDRYITVRPSLSGNNGCLQMLKSKQGLVALASLCFIWSVAAAGSILIENELANKLPTICLGIIDIFAMTVIFVLYIRMYIRVWRHTKTSVVYKDKVNEEQTIKKIKCKRKSKLRFQNELAKTVLLIMIAVPVCYLPLIVSHAYVTGYSKGTISNRAQFVYHISFPIAYLNSFLNACIVLYRNRTLRRYLERNMIWTSSRTNGQDSQPRL